MDYRTQGHILLLGSSFLGSFLGHGLNASQIRLRSWKAWATIHPISFQSEPQFKIRQVAVTYCSFSALVGTDTWTLQMLEIHLSWQAWHRGLMRYISINMKLPSICNVWPSGRVELISLALMPTEAPHFAPCLAPKAIPMHTWRRCKSAMPHQQFGLRVYPENKVLNLLNKLDSFGLQNHLHGPNCSCF